MITDGGDDLDSDGDCADHGGNDENGVIHDNDADDNDDDDDDKDDDDVEEDKEEDDMWIKHTDESNICYSL